MQGFLFVISGPSAVGKTSVAQEILNRRHTVKRVVTCTTRAPRGQEKDGADYNFLLTNEFIQKVEAGEFVEFSKVYDNYYGVLFSSITSITDSGEDALLVINWEGFQKIRKKMKENVVGLFILPPSIEVLEERMRSRGHDSEETIQKRLKMNKVDMLHADDFDYQIVNHKIEDAALDILQLVDKIKEEK